MIFRACVLLFAVVLLAGCSGPKKKEDLAKRKEPAKLKDAAGDASFQVFLNRLQKAIDSKDRVALASTFAPDFGYRWDRGPEGETPFDFWDKNKLWGTLSALVRERWMPHEAFMVVPPEFAMNDSYPGFRAGLTTVDGKWRFAYFVPAPSSDGASPAAPSVETRPAHLPPLPE